MLNVYWTPGWCPDMSDSVRRAAEEIGSPLHSIPPNTFLDLIPDAIVVVDQSGTIVRANSLTSRIFGYEPDELLGQKVEMLVPERHRTQHETHRREFESHPKVRSMGPDLDLLGRRRDGSEFPVEISLSPIQTNQ